MKKLLRRAFGEWDSVGRDIAKKSAFTLAEVLITLGIIGVVAAITLPTLIQNYQKQVLVTQLKKMYATLNEGFKRIAVNEKCSTIICAGLKYRYMSDDNDSLFSLDFSNERTKEKIVKEFKLENVFVGTAPSNSIYNYEVKYLFVDDKTSFLNFLSDDEYSLVGTTSSGEIIVFNGYSILVDINGLKSPNTFGRDIFVFAFLNYNGSTVVVPAGSKIHVGVEAPEMGEAERIEMVNKNCSITSDDAAGDVCAEKIIMDGWKMNY